MPLFVIKNSLMVKNYREGRPLPSLKLAAVCTWKVDFLGTRPIFRGLLAVSFREDVLGSPPSSHLGGGGGVDPRMMNQFFYIPNSPV